MNHEEINAIIHKLMKESLSHARSEIGYSSGRKSRKPQQKAYNKASRWDSRKDIRSQMSEDPIDDIDTLLIPDLVPIGRDAFIALEGEDSFEDPRTGRSHSFSKRTQYLDKLASDYVFGDVEMDPDYVDRLAELSPEFESSLSSAFDEIEDLDNRGYYEMNESDNKFGRGAIRDFFRDTLYENEPSAPILRSSNRTSRRTLTEAVEDYTLGPLDQDDTNRLAQAIVTGINLEFDINASGPDLVDLEEQVQYHLAKHPGLPEILFDIAMEAMLELSDDFGERDQKGNVVVTDDDDAEYEELVDLLDDIASPGWIRQNLEDGLTKDQIIAKAQRGEVRSRAWMSTDSDDDDDMAPLDVAGSDRAEMVDIVAGEVYDTMDSSRLDDGWLSSLVEDMVEMGKLDGEMWHSSDIDIEEIRDRVVEIEDENADITGL